MRSEMNYSVSVQGNAAQGMPPFSGNFGRINVVLGENGSGKSRLLIHLFPKTKEIFGSEFNALRIEGGRAINIPVNVGFEHGAEVFGKIDSKLEEYLSTNKSGSLAARVQEVFLVLRALEDRAKRQHSDAVVEWQNAGSQGPSPGREEAPFELFRKAFSSVFPDLSVTISTGNQLYVAKGGHPYAVQSMSDGEKQVFLLLADLAVLKRAPTVFYIDEPELNLHPSLAIKVWEAIEQKHTDSVFVYATHSLQFALRQSVDAVWCLPFGQISFDSKDLQRVNLQPFLGAIGGIVCSTRCLFVEGEDNSFDKPFYRWLLGQADLDVVAVGSSSEVIAAAGRRSVWGQISPQVKVAGVIDGDFGAHRNLNGVSNVVQLKLREVESFLCDPAVLIALQKKLRNTDRILTEDIVVERLARLAETSQLRTIAQRVFAEARIDLAVSLERKVVGEIGSPDALLESILVEAANERQKAELLLNNEEVRSLFARVQMECRSAIEKRDAGAMLTLFDAKRALSELCKLAGCATPVGLLTAVLSHFSPEEFPRLAVLRKDILATLERGAN